MNEEYRRLITQLFESIRTLQSVASEDVYGNVIALETYVINAYLCGTDNKNADRYLDGFYAHEVTADDLIAALAWPKECDRFE